MGGLLHRLGGGFWPRKSKVTWCAMTVAVTEDDRCTTKRRWRSDEQRSVPVEVGRREYVTYFKIEMGSLMGRDIGHSSRVAAVCGSTTPDLMRPAAENTPPEPLDGPRRRPKGRGHPEGASHASKALGRFLGVRYQTRDHLRRTSVTQPEIGGQDAIDTASWCRHRLNAG